MTRQEKSSKMGVRCHVCDTICTGEVLKVQDKHFHIKCFTCTECQESLASGGYFLKDNVYYCKKDYQRLFGMKCAHCERYVEGRVVTALGKMYHPDCFICSQCRNPISTGAVLTGSGTKILCHTCGAHHSKKGPAPTTSPLAYLSEQKTSQSPPHVTSPYPMSSSSNFSLTSTSSNDPTSPNSTHPALPTRYRPSPPPGLSTTFNQYMGSRSAKPLERRERVEGTRSQASSSTSLSQQQQQNPSHGSHSRTSSLPVFTPPPSDGHAHHSSQSLSLSRHPPAHASKSVQYSPSPSPASITHRVSTPLLDLPGGGVGGGSAHSLNRVSSGVPSYPDSPYFVSSHQRSMSLDRGRSMNSSEVDGAVPSGSSPHQHPPPREGGSSDDPGNIKMGVCAGCKESISTTGTSLLALAQHWHTRCLCCVKCSRGVLDEVVNSDGVPYCLDCFNRDRGSICASCQQYILGTGLQAADQSFHLDCAKCNRCGSGFEENEDMCLLGSTLWHLKCDAELESALSACSSARTTPTPTPTAAPPYSSTAPMKAYTLPSSQATSVKRGGPQRSETLPENLGSLDATQSSDLSNSSSGSIVPGRFVKTAVRASVSDKIRLFSEEKKRREAEKANGMGVDSEGNTQSSDPSTEERLLQDEYALIYSLGMLQFSVINNSKLPKGADRTKLECYLSEEDFHKAFHMSRAEFSGLPMWKQVELKKEANLF